MSGFGTDFLALACILGGSATGGAITMAIVLSTPHLEMHAAHDCQMVVAGEVKLHMEEVRREMEEARGRVEVVRIHMDEARALAEAARASVDQLRLEELQVILEKVEKGSGGQMD